MRKLSKIVLLATLLGCREREKDIFQENLIGIWKLIDYCKPNGPSPCAPTRVPNDKGVFISFSSRNEFREFYQNTKPIEYAFLGCGGGTYEVESQKLRIRALCMSSSNGQLFEVVSVTQQRLVLNPFGSGEYVFEKQ